MVVFAFDYVLCVCVYVCVFCVQTTLDVRVTPARDGLHNAKKRLQVDDHGNDMSPQLLDDPIALRPSSTRPFLTNGNNLKKKGPKKHAGLGSKPLKARNGGCGSVYREGKLPAPKKVSVSYQEYGGDGSS